MINLSGLPDYSNNDGIMYYSNGFQILYLFDRNNRLETVGTQVNIDYTADLLAFLRERYPEVGQSSNMLLLVNGLTPATITTTIGAELTDFTRWTVAYVPYSQTRAQDENPVLRIEEAFNDLVNQ